MEYFWGWYTRAYSKGYQNILSGVFVCSIAEYFSELCRFFDKPVAGVSQNSNKE